MNEAKPATMGGGATWALPAYLAVLVLLAAVAALHAPPDERTVILRRADLDARLDSESRLRGRDLTPEERDALITNLVEDAVLLREAVRRRLDRDDPLIRSTLLGRVARELGGDVPTPTDAEVRAYYDARPERYARAATIAFEHALVQDDAEPAELLARLRAGEDPGEVGGIPTVPARFGKATRLDLVRTFGGAFADRVLALEDGTWHGPLVSTLGTHFVKITGREPGAPRAFVEVATYVRQDLEGERVLAALGRELEPLRERYEVRIEGGAR